MHGLGEPSGCISTQWKIFKLTAVHYSPPVYPPTPAPVHTPSRTFTHTPLHAHVDPPCLADSTSGVETCDHIVFSVHTCNIYNLIKVKHILLDTCAGESVFNDSSLSYNVEHAPTPMIVSGVNPKGKPLIIKKRGVSAFGNVYYSPNCAGNILSFGNAVRDCTDVKYLHEYDCYIVQDDSGKCFYRFSRDETMNIYQCNLDTMVTECMPLLVTTVEERKKKYTVRQVRDAELARDYQRRLGYASAAQTIKLIFQGNLTNSKVTARDVHRAIDIWGPDVGSLKGKTTSHQAKLEEKLPLLVREHETEQIMYIDIMFVN